ncbi:MAG: YeeE/YedE family protein [Rhizobiales bacterium]|nr:YeeE/YedE family protein [Hyphomicrobiales bacterium]
MRIAVHAIIGLIFGLGLVVSGMVDPAKVQNFLDIFGIWDPSLAFVMAGAVLVAFAGYRLAWRNATPMLDDQFHLPKSTAIDRRLILGAAVFGTGWGLGGYCPGPALTAMGLLAPGTIAFVPAMLIGMWLARMTANATQSAAIGSKP